MPKLPDSTPQISLNVPGVQAPASAGFGRVGTALEGVGGTIASSGADMFERAKQAEATDAANSAYMVDKLNLEQKAMDLKRQSPDGYMHEDASNPASPYQRNEDGSPRTLTQSVHEAADEMYQRSQENMPNAIAAEMYRSRMMPHVTDTLGMVQAEAQALKIQSYDQKDQAIRQTVNNNALTNPGQWQLGPTGQIAAVNIGDFYKDANDIQINQASQVPNLFGAPDAEKRARAQQAEAAYMRVRGALPQILDMKKQGQKINQEDAVHAWIDVLNGEDPASRQQKALGKKTLSDMMDPGQKAQELLKLTSMLPTTRDNDSTMLFAQAKDLAERAMNGRPNGPKPADRDAMLSALQTLAAKGLKPGQLVEASRVGADLINSFTLGSFQGPGLERRSDSEKAALMGAAIPRVLQQADAFGASIGAPGLGGQYANELQAKVTSLIEGSKKQKQDDMGDFVSGGTAHNGQAILPSGHVMVGAMDFSRPEGWGDTQRSAWATYSRDVKQWAKSGMDGYQDKFALVPFDKAKQLAKGLSDISVRDADHAWSALQGMRRTYGADFGAVMKQLMERPEMGESKLSAAWGSVLFNPDMGPKVISAIRGEAFIHTDFELARAKTKIGPTELEDAVGKTYTDNFLAHAIGVDPTSETGHRAVSQIGGLLKTYAKEVYTQRVQQDGSPSVDDVAKDAFNQLIGDHFHYGDPSATGAGAGIRGVFRSPQPWLGIPESVLPKGEYPTVSENTRRLKTEEGLKELGVPITAPGGQDKGSEGKYHETILNGSPYWSFANGDRRGPGFYLIYRQQSGPIGSPVAGQQRNAMGADGQPVFLPLDRARVKHVDAVPTTKHYDPATGKFTDVPVNGALAK